MDRKHVFEKMKVTTLYGNFPDVLNEFTDAFNIKNKKLTDGFFSNDELQITKIILDIMLPPVSLQDAREIKVPYFIELVVKNCLDSNDQQLIKKGLQQLNQQAGGKFSSLPKEKQLSIIKQLEHAAVKGDEDKVWFRIFKKLVTIGYFAARDGAQKALQYVQVPGESDGCVPYSTGDNTREKIYLMY